MKILHKLEFKIFVALDADNTSFVKENSLHAVNNCYEVKDYRGNK